MAADKSTITFDVAECRVYPMTADGETITYGDAVAVPGIQEVTVEANFVTAELKGDGGKVLAKKGKIDRLNFSATYSELSLLVMSTIYGGGTTSDGVAPDGEISSYSFNSRSLPYFKIEFKIDDIESDLAEIVMILDKCQVTGGSIMGGSTDNFGQPKFDAEAILAQATGSFGKVEFREAATGLND